MARLLLDENLPRRLRGVLPPHAARTVQEMRWNGLKNGVLLRRGQAEFDVFITMDRSIPFQQSVAGLEIAVLVITARQNSFQAIKPLVPAILRAIQSAQAGRVVTVGDAAARD